MYLHNEKDTKKVDTLKEFMDEKKVKGAWIGMQWLDEGDIFEVRGGRGNKLLSELKVEDGLIYIKTDGEWIIASA